jgi:hypothetical protein
MFTCQHAPTTQNGFNQTSRIKRFSHLQWENVPNLDDYFAEDEKATLYNTKHSKRLPQGDKFDYTCCREKIYSQDPKDKVNKNGYNN